MNLKYIIVKTLRKNTEHLITKNSQIRWYVVNNTVISSIPIDIMKGAFLNESYISCRN